MPALASDPAHPVRGSWLTVVADSGPGDRLTHELGERALLPISLLRSGVALGFRRGRRQAVSTAGAACGNAVARRGYFGVFVWAKSAKGLFEL